jgi:hypothetical protein
VSSESRVLGIEQDLNFELAVEIADRIVMPILTSVSTNLKSKSLGGQESDEPVTNASVLVSSDSITDVRELDKEEILANGVASKNATARGIGVRLI